MVYNTSPLTSIPLDNLRNHIDQPSASLAGGATTHYPV